jgi:hypothetical protein
MTDLRAQIEQLRRFSVNRLDDMLQDDPEGNLVLIDDVLALLADHAAPVVAPRCGCGQPLTVCKDCAVQLWQAVSQLMGVEPAAPVVAPSEAVCDICHERAACGCGNLRAFAAPVVAPPSEQQSAEGQCIPIAARYFPESEERYSRCLAALCEAFALGQKVAPVVGETPSKEG